MGYERKYHVCLTPQAIADDPTLLPTVAKAGVTTVWLIVWGYGHWFAQPSAIRAARAAVMANNLEAQALICPLGHPGDSLLDPTGEIPLTPPTRWQMYEDAHGRPRSGTSLHAPATADITAAVAELAAIGFTQIFHDDDLRLAVGNEPAGCFCVDCRTEYVAAIGGDPEAVRTDVLNDRDTPQRRAWLDWQCQRLARLIAACDAAAPSVENGVMVMHFGSERAGIPITHLGSRPLRVGEGHFDATSFGSVAGRTGALLSALLHAHMWGEPKRLFSETTSFPAPALGARLLSAKLATSTIAGIANTLFMSGLTPLPSAWWTELAPAMRHHAELTRRVAGHSMRGPLQLWWGPAGRQQGHLDGSHLALGVPFEVTEQPRSGALTWCHAGDATAVRAVGGIPLVNGDDSTSWKTALIARDPAIPHVVEDVPVVCVWYPTTRLVLLWEITDRAVSITLRTAGGDRQMTLNPLSCTLLSLES